MFAKSKVKKFVTKLSIKKIVSINLLILCDFIYCMVLLVFSVILILLRNEFFYVQQHGLKTADLYNHVENLLALMAFGYFSPKWLYYQIVSYHVTWILEQRGKKKKKKKAILKLLILGAVLKAKIGTLLQILSFKLQVILPALLFFRFWHINI